MNIIWKQPNNTLAVTSIFDGSDPFEHAELLRSRGDVPADWELVATGIDSFPQDWPFQEDWIISGGSVIVDESRKQKRIKNTIQTQIDAMESQSKIPRITREFMLSVIEKEATDAGLTLDQLFAQNIGYRKLKELDSQIRSLRAQL